MDWKSFLEEPSNAWLQKVFSHLFDERTGRYAGSVYGFLGIGRGSILPYFMDMTFSLRS